jgi:hypothetical protein
MAYVYGSRVLPLGQQLWKLFLKQTEYYTEAVLKPLILQSFLWIKFNTSEM